jgi:hypothetical protein
MTFQYTVYKRISQDLRAMVHTDRAEIRFFRVLIISSMTNSTTGVVWY